MDKAQTDNYNNSYWEHRLGRGFPCDVKVCPTVSRRAAQEGPECPYCRLWELRPVA